MISFKQFITEEIEFDIEQFKKDCDFTLSRLKGSGIMWHGTPQLPKEFEIKNWKPRTGPKDSSIELHNIFNQFSLKTFGVEARNWLFTSGLRARASIFTKGNSVSMIFPIGEFEWLSSPDRDFSDLTAFHTSTVYRIQDAPEKKLNAEQKEELANNLIAKKLPHVKWYFNEYLDRSIESGNEIMIKCNKFYIINERSDAGTQIKKLLGLSLTDTPITNYIK